MERVTEIILGGSQITADGDCSHEIKRHLLALLLGRKAMANLDSKLKSRDITLPTMVPIVKAVMFLVVIFKSRNITLPKKVCLVKAMVFPVVMYGCESWTVKKAER